MITGEIKSQIDKIWTDFWTGGIANPLTVIEQFTYLLFIRRLDEIQLLKEKKANLVGVPLKDPIYTDEQKELRWSSFKNADPEVMYHLFQKENGVFDFMKNVGAKGSVFAGFMKGATFMIPTPRLLDMVVQQIDKIKMEDRDTKGDLYEYLLSKTATAGTNGQFRTPRHIIKMMVEMMQPKQDDTICDPACGTAGFLVAAGEYIHENHKDWFNDAAFREHYNNGMFTGSEFDATMMRIAAMNLQLHGIETPTLISKDALSEANADMDDQFTLILANPPFKGSLDYDSVESSILKKVKTKKTELLFLGLMLRALKTGGRCAVIVPDGVLFGSSKAHKQIRQELVEGQRLQAVISMPSGVFKPYAGVSTAVLIFTKTNSGGTDKVWFYDMRADGLSLDDKRNPIKENDIPDILKRWSELENEAKRERTERSFLVPFAEIKANDWDLSINRYKEIEHEEVQFDSPLEIMVELRQLDAERADALKKLEELLG
ncbi:type I restriction enzyme M protein [Mangrovibacterium marinum]|uniref:site-specific DNA-methyltransferase (adenine-specific) n=1 Tax=Mangrovibacterium marinum TaxID=1639118 RepID=A0A2T5C585_9BACT|nr:class I SAM-dependent DNA methyltransferase [Mangrovibacterium marinum]PTN10053.1 type I restriction enzyme M protein [Mangrovibacterium marinum]